LNFEALDRGSLMSNFPCHGAEIDIILSPRSICMPAVYVIFEAPINGSTSQKFIATISQLVNQGATSIELLLSTPGGEVPAGLTMYNFLKSLPIPVNTYNIGNVDSIGNAVFLAGVTRKACKHSTFMFHGVGFFAQNVSFEEKNRLDSILADQKRIGEILQERTKISASEAGELFREARTKDANYALSVEIVSSIEDVALAQGAPIVTIVTN
jgi:ATP-dependent protease ClpP protease subunit